jgi:hypothetical protein
VLGEHLPLRRPGLGPPVHLVHHPALKGVKRGTVDRVDNGNSQLVCRRPPENAGLRAVGMDNLRFDRAEQPADVAVALPIAEWMNFAAQFGDDPQVELLRASPFDEAPLGTDRRTGNESHVVVPEVVLIFDR